MIGTRGSSTSGEVADLFSDGAGMDQDLDAALASASGARMARRSEDTAASEAPPSPAGPETGPSATAAITIQAWTPDTPYLKAMTTAGPAEAYAVYLDQRGEYFESPAFYLDCASYLLDADQRELGLRVLTSILDLELEEASLIRVVAHKAHQIGELELSAQLFERVLEMRPEEPQSHRDLALVLGEQLQYPRALELFNAVVTGDWDDRFPEIETIALMEANRLLAEAERGGAAVDNPLDSRLVKLLDVDMRIILTWDTDLTDMDLWVIEPTGEKCMYNHARTMIGGRMSRDFTRGYGPEEYFVRRGMPGEVQIQVNYYGSGQVTLTGGTTIQIDVFTNYGRADESKRSITKRLTTNKEVVDIGEVMFEGT
jgi:Ca-activated chloride channel homolog